MIATRSNDVLCYIFSRLVWILILIVYIPVSSIVALDVIAITKVLLLLLLVQINPRRPPWPSGLSLCLGWVRAPHWPHMRQAKLAGVPGGFSRSFPVFAPVTDWPVSYELK